MPTLTTIFGSIAANVRLILAVGIMLIVCWNLHEIDVRRLENEKDEALEKQEFSLLAECELDKALTTEVSHDYQQNIAALAARIDSSMRVQPARCVPVAGTSAGRDAAAGAGHAGGDGVPAQKLIEYAGQAELYRLRLLSCQEFIAKVWDSKQ